MPSGRPDAIVIGSGPNGLAAAIVIAQTGRKVIVFEANETIGGGARSAELTLPGFTHDMGSAMQPATGFARRTFTGEHARGLFAGIAGHGMLPLDMLPSAAFGLVLGALAHVVGWVMPRGGAQRITDALASHLRSLGGEIVTSS